PDLADNLQPHVERRQQLAVVIVEHDIVDPDAPARFPGLLAPTGGQGTATLRLVTRVAVRDGDEPDVVAQRRPPGRGASGTLVAVVRMRSERDDVEPAVAGWRLCDR